MLIIITQYLNV